MLLGNRYEKERKRRDGPQNNGWYWTVITMLSAAWLVITSHFTNLFVSIITEAKNIGNTNVLKALLFDENYTSVNGGQVQNALDLSNFSNWSMLFQHKGLWLVVELVLLALMLPLLWKSWKKHNPQVGNQYGNARFTTQKELKRQYTQIPDKINSFEGYGGVPMSHIKPNFYQSIVQKKQPEYLIDQNTVNSLIVAISRAGKGETLVVPLIDILSRAKEQSSMFIADPKSELYKMSYQTLRKRGYIVKILNLQDTDFSVSYNPLQVVIDYAKDGYFDEVQEEINKFSTSIYHDPNAKDKFWQDSSINLLNSMVLALIDLAKRTNDWSIVTMDNVLHLLTDLGGQEVSFNKEGRIIPSQEELSSNQAAYEEDRQVFEKRNKLSFYFDLLREANKQEYSAFRQMALDAFAQSRFAGKEAHGSIYSTTMQGIKLYQQSNIAKLTSMNNLDFVQMGFPRVLKMKLGPSEVFSKVPLTANVSFLDANGQIIEKRSQVFDKLGFLHYTLKATLPKIFRVEVNFKHHNNLSEYQNWKIVLSGQKTYCMENLRRKRDPYSHKAIIKDIVFKTEKAIGVKLKEAKLNYSEQPVAVFFVTPPNNESYNDLAAFAIDQAFTQLSKLAFENEGKCYRRVHFILDEFGNLPAINSMHTKLSIGLSQQLLFDLVVQNLEQLELHYEQKQAATIEGNCGNLFYILTQSKQTAETISAKIGKKTVRVDTTSGKVGDAHQVNQSVQFIGQPLISGPELMNLMEGEMIVLRSILRRDKKGNLVSALPIFNQGKNRMPNRWENIREQFDDRVIMSDLGLSSLHRNFDLEKERVDFDQATKELIKLSQKEFYNQLEETSNTSDVVDDESVFNLKEGRLEDQVITKEELENVQIVSQITTVLNQAFNRIALEENPDAQEAVQALREDDQSFWSEAVNNNWHNLEEWIGNPEVFQGFRKQVEQIKMKEG